MEVLPEHNSINVPAASIDESSTEGMVSQIKREMHKLGMVNDDLPLHFLSTQHPDFIIDVDMKRKTSELFNDFGDIMMDHRFHNSYTPR